MDAAEELTTEQIASLRQLLEARRAALVTSIDEHRHEEREVGRDVGDEMDEASIEGTTAMLSKFLERDARVLGEVDHALAKIDAGTYGVCEGTGEPIGFDRLRLQPWARHSVAYQEELERDARIRGM